MAPGRTLLKMLVVLAPAVVAGTGVAAPPAGSGAGDVAAQLKDVNARITAARTHHKVLQAQVAQMEQQNAAQQKQLQQKDAEIAALQQKLRAGGAPAPAHSGS